MRIIEGRIHFQGLAHLFDRLIVTPCAVVSVAQVRVNHEREGIEHDRPLYFGNGFIEASYRGEP